MSDLLTRVADMFKEITECRKEVVVKNKLLIDTESDLNTLNHRLEELEKSFAVLTRIQRPNIKLGEVDLSSEDFKPDAIKSCEIISAAEKLNALSLKTKAWTYGLCYNDWVKSQQKKPYKIGELVTLSDGRMGMIHLVGRGAQNETQENAELCVQLGILKDVRGQLMNPPVWISQDLVVRRSMGEVNDKLQKVREQSVVPKTTGIEAIKKSDADRKTWLNSLRAMSKVFWINAPDPGSVYELISNPTRKSISPENDFYEICKDTFFDPFFHSSRFVQGKELIATLPLLETTKWRKGFNKNDKIIYTKTQSWGRSGEPGTVYSFDDKAQKIQVHLYASSGLFYWAEPEELVLVKQEPREAKSASELSKVEYISRAVKEQDKKVADKSCCVLCGPSNTCHCNERRTEAEHVQGFPRCSHQEKDAKLD